MFKIHGNRCAANPEEIEQIVQIRRLGCRGRKAGEQAL
jgi:hypothetical protein